MELENCQTPVVNAPIDSVLPRLENSALLKAKSPEQLELEMLLEEMSQLIIADGGIVTL